MRREGKRQIQLLAGTPLSVMILVTSTNFVKVRSVPVPVIGITMLEFQVDDVSINEDKRPVDIRKIIADLHKKNLNQKPQRSEGD